MPFCFAYIRTLHTYKRTLHTYKRTLHTYTRIAFLFKKSLSDYCTIQNKCLTLLTLFNH